MLLVEQIMQLPKTPVKKTKMKGVSTESRFAKDNTFHSISKIMILISSILVIIYFVYNMIYMILEMIDDSLWVYSSGSNDLYKQNAVDTLNIFLKLFDAFKVIALFALLATFILLLLYYGEKYRKQFIIMTASFGVYAFFYMIVVILRYGDFRLDGFSTGVISQGFYFDFSGYATAILVLQLLAWIGLAVTLFTCNSFFEQAQEDFNLKPIRFSGQFGIITSIILLIIGAIIGSIAMNGENEIFQAVTYHMNEHTFEIIINGIFIGIFTGFITKLRKIPAIYD
jgi:hypothetical protein